MLILGAVGLQIRLSDCSMFRSTFGRLQSKNVFPAKIQQDGRSNLTFRSFRSINLGNQTLFNIL